MLNKKVDIEKLISKTKKWKYTWCVIGHTCPRVWSQIWIVAFSNTKPDRVDRTGSFITCPLIAHKNSSGIEESLLFDVTSWPPITIFGTGLVDSPGSSSDKATWTSRPDRLPESEGKLPSKRYPSPLICCWSALLSAIFAPRLVWRSIPKIKCNVNIIIKLKLKMNIILYCSLVL